MNRKLVYQDKKGKITLYRQSEKVLVSCICAGCKIPGMAYEDPDRTFQEPHYCILCKKRLNK